MAKISEYTVNATNTSDIVQLIVTDLTNLQNEVERLANAVELLGVAGKKTLGADADKLFDEVDAFRARQRVELGEDVIRSYDNPIGAPYQTQRDPEPNDMELERARKSKS